MTPDQALTRVQEWQEDMEGEFDGYPGFLHILSASEVWQVIDTLADEVKRLTGGKACERCGKDPADGLAEINGKRYCHGDATLISCYEQEVRRGGPAVTDNDDLLALARQRRSPDAYAMYDDPDGDLIARLADEIERLRGVNNRPGSPRWT